MMQSIALGAVAVLSYLAVERFVRAVVLVYVETLKK